MSLEKAVLVVRHAMRQRALEAENRDLRAQVDRRHTLIGESPAMRHLREQVLLAAPTNGRVLILGENGTGKEVVARTLHAHSRRRSGPFVEVNCAAIPEELIESELFGHARGAFTGAVADRRGRFEHAHGGTIFLDEIGDMSLKTQAKVLRALQEQVVQPVGGTATVRVDVRVVAATNKDLQDEIRAGRFREDLFFRLNVVPIFVPPLRDRADDVPRLAEHFMATLAGEYGRLKRFAPEAMARLQQHSWPGNVRELHNVVERLLIMVAGDVITLNDVGFVGDSPLARAGAGQRRRHRPAGRGPRSVRARLHPPGAGGQPGQHLAHRRRPRRRAQQPLQEDARASGLRRRGATPTDAIRRATGFRAPARGGSRPAAGRTPPPGPAPRPAPARPPRFPAPSRRSARPRA